VLAVARAGWTTQALGWGAHFLRGALGQSVGYVGESLGYFGEAHAIAHCSAFFGGFEDACASQK